MVDWTLGTDGVCAGAVESALGTAGTCAATVGVALGTKGTRAVAVELTCRPAVAGALLPLTAV